MLVNLNSNHKKYSREGIKELSQHNIVITVFFKSSWQASNHQTKSIKMKFIIVFALCIVAALAAPAAPADVSITKEVFETPSDAGYKFA